MSNLLMAQPEFKFWQTQKQNYFLTVYRICNKQSGKHK